MDLDRRKLLAFGLAGALWILGLTVLFFLFNLELVPGAAGYFLVFTLAVASRRFRMEVTLLAAWVAAVLAMGAVVYSADGEIGAVIFLGGVLGTFLLGGWVVTGFLLLLLIDPDRRKVTT